MCAAAVGSCDRDMLMMKSLEIVVFKVMGVGYDDFAWRPPPISGLFACM